MNDRKSSIKVEFIRRGPDGVPTTSFFCTDLIAKLMPERFSERFDDASVRAGLLGVMGKLSKLQGAEKLPQLAIRLRMVKDDEGTLPIEMPDRTQILIADEPYALVVKSLIEDFARVRLKNPVVLWIGASDKKAYPQFVELSASVGLRFDLGAELPDLILAEMDDPVRFLLCEVVATDGAVTEARKQALLALIKSSDIPETTAHFLTAFEDRESAALRKNFSKLAVDSLVWFRTEPELLLILTSGHRLAVSLTKESLNAN